MATYDHDRLIEDIKQLLDVRLSQSEARLESLMDLKIDVFRQDMNAGFAYIGDIVTVLNDRTDSLEERVNSLEKQAA